MALGPGKYDEELTAALESASRRGPVRGGILIVIGEPGGHGFSCQATGEVLVRLPLMLRYIADQIEADLKRGKL
jgi:hypothetical protein